MEAGVQTQSGMGKLEAMLEAARAAVAQRRERVPLAVLKEATSSRPEKRPFREALTRSGISLIAEFKRHSPTAGPLTDPDVADQVRLYEAGGATALSVLTDEAHFHGKLVDLETARQASSLPILRKDFMVDEYQLYEAVAKGADAVLLIVAAHDDESLNRLYRQALSLDLDCIVEVRDGDELGRAVDLDVDVIGINNRDLVELKIDLQKTFDLMPDVPTGKTVVSESGISERTHLEQLEEIGVDAVLIGEALMRAPDPEVKVRELTADEEATREHVL